MDNRLGLKYFDITSQIIGSAMKVHRYFGVGYPENIYRRSLMIELQNTLLNVQAEVEQTIVYKDQIVGKRRVDLIVEQKILVEVKAISTLDKECYNQVLNYLKVFEFEVALLLNFGKGSLEYKRFANNTNTA